MTDTTPKTPERTLADTVASAIAAAETGQSVIVGYFRAMTARMAFETALRELRRSARVKRITRSPGSEAVYFATGGVVRFMGLGAYADRLRGMSADLVVLVDPSPAAREHSAIVVAHSGGTVVDLYTSHA